MKLIPQKIVDKAYDIYHTNANYGEGAGYLLKSEVCFKAGVEFAESKFQEAFKDIIIENQGLKLYKDNEARRFEELAIDFAKYLFSTEITKHTSMENSVKYIPSEFNLMKGNLIKNGKELFKQFLKERNE